MIKKATASLTTPKLTHWFNLGLHIPSFEVTKPKNYLWFFQQKFRSSNGEIPFVFHQKNPQHKGFLDVSQISAKLLTLRLVEKMI